MRTSKFVFLGLALLAPLFVAACDDEEVITPPPPISVTVAPTSATIAIGQTVQLAAVVNNSTNQSVTFTSGASAIATVSASGLVTGVTAGTAVITVAAAADPNARAFATIVVTAPPPSAVQVDVQPATASIAIGSTVQLVAIVTGTNNVAVTWLSSNTAIATVSATGVVTCVAAGTVTITATSQADTNARDVAVITCTTTPPAPPPSISIKSVTFGTTFTPVVPGAVAGQIDVTINFDIPAGQTVNRLEVLLNGNVLDGSPAGEPNCTQTFTGGSADVGDAAAASASEIICSINTAAFAPITATTNAVVGVFLNGNYQLQARLVTPTSSITATWGQTLTFANADVLVGFSTTTPVTSTPGGAVDPGGLFWFEGDLNLRAVPVTYVQGVTVDRVTFTYTDAKALVSVQTDATPADGFRVTMAKAAAAGGATNGSAAMNSGAAGAAPAVTSVYNNGNPGPAGFVNAGVFTPNGPMIRLDNEAPAVGAYAFTDQGVSGTGVETVCCSANWVGAAIAFASFYTVGGETDAPAGVAGVGGTATRRTFHVGAAGATTATIAASAAVAVGGDVAAASDATNNVRASAVRVRDALGNATNGRLAVSGANPGANGFGATFGVDVVAPTIAFAGGSTASRTINPGGGSTWIVSFSDDVSGFTGTPARVLQIRNFSTTTAALCHAPAIFSGGVCRRGADDSFTAIAGTGGADPQGYFEYSGFVRDQGGNGSATIGGLDGSLRVAGQPEAIILNDGTAPTTSNVAIPAALVGGASTTFSATVSDNVDLLDVDLRLGFAVTPDFLSFGPRVGIGDGVGFNTTRSLGPTEAVASVNFVRSLEESVLVAGFGAGGRANDTPTGVLQAADEVRFLVRDVATNTSIQTNAFAVGTVPAGSAAGGLGLVTFEGITPAVETSVCNGLGACGTRPTSTTLAAQATGASGTFANPFAAVHFYRVDAGGAIIWIGVDTTGEVTDDGVTRFWSWSITFVATGVPGQGNAGAANGVEDDVPVFSVGVDANGDGLRTAPHAFLRICGSGGVTC